MENPENLPEFEAIANTILLIRGKKVMLDADLAKVYQVTTKQLNQAVKRNIERFPPDFMFRLTKEEKEKVVTECDHLNNLKFSPYEPNAFTEHGALMLASILNTPAAIHACVQVVRTFVRMREIVDNHAIGFENHIAERLAHLEHKSETQFQSILQAIQQLRTGGSLPEAPSEDLEDFEEPSAPTPEE
ncbi:ORF6N domain-containing protein [Eisenibacter elegans]|jgi:hypothetical protein|uniref:ORF6N domain-containing protein n=1 Tax=Eisenibacter elegans TaxID=997 RepID=UPI0003F9CE43|nr:ORF6N domain-containing protein [Eisenibacter elegans]